MLFQNNEITQQSEEMMSQPNVPLDFQEDQEMVDEFQIIETVAP